MNSKMLKSFGTAMLVPLTVLSLATVAHAQTFAPSPAFAANYTLIWSNANASMISVGSLTVGRYEPAHCRTPPPTNAVGGRAAGAGLPRLRVQVSHLAI